VRVLSYNVRSLRDDQPALVRIVRALDPDVVCVQEAPRFFLGRHHTRRWARECGLRRICGGRPANGPAVLARPGRRVQDVAEHRFRRTPGLHGRGLAVARVDGVVVASMHLGLTPAERLRNIRDVLAALGPAVRGPLVLAGDLNEPPESPAWQLLAESGLRDAYALAPTGPHFTFPARDPQRRIDAVFVTDLLHVVSCGVPALDEADLVAATDHLPVLAELMPTE
jgi:endonuclease/exonuclease/phosphatase family metal-dependent hydrolase